MDENKSKVYLTREGYCCFDYISYTKHCICNLYILGLVRSVKGIQIFLKKSSRPYIQHYTVHMTCNINALRFTIKLRIDFFFCWGEKIVGEKKFYCNVIASVKFVSCIADRYESYNMMEYVKKIKFWCI